jgi:hypothetical protein
VSQSGVFASFQIGGYWIVDVTISAGGQTDLIRFGLDL